MGRHIRQLWDGELRADRAKGAEDAKLDGKCLLSAADPSLPAEGMAFGYKQPPGVEEAFQTLKSRLEPRPVCHRLPDRTRAHVLLCWLAPLLVRVGERETGPPGGRARCERSRGSTLAERAGVVGPRRLGQRQPRQNGDADTGELQAPRDERPTALAGRGRTDR
jgi:hypothetical protein